MWAGLWKQFTTEERALLATATVDDVMAPAEALGARLPATLRAKFMAEVIRRMPAVPLDDYNLRTDPEPPR